MKIIFDRSAFHGDSFDLLQGSSQLLQLIKQRKILVFHTAAFLEETLRMSRSRENVKKELLRQGPFLLSICNGGWFRQLFDICREELDGSGALEERVLVPNPLRDAVEQRLAAFFGGSSPLEEIDSAVPLWHANENKKKLQKNVLACYRAHNPPRKGERFCEYYKSVANDCATRLIRWQLDIDPPDAKAIAWSQEPSKFPYVTAFVELCAYSIYDAEHNQNSRLDRNWQTDAEQLCFLFDVDLMISSEQGFMRRAFVDVWAPRGKRFLTPQEFLNSLR